MKKGMRGFQKSLLPLQAEQAAELRFKVLSPINYESVSIRAERKATESRFNGQWPVQEVQCPAGGSRLKTHQFNSSHK